MRSFRWPAIWGGSSPRTAPATTVTGPSSTEAYDVLRASGYLALAVPTELGGMGATIGQVAAAQAEMARHCASTALAVSMHLHITLFAAWRYRREMPGAEAMLRRVVDDRIVFVSTGGSDFTRPNGTAEKVDGGYVVNGRKVFASQVPVGDVFSTHVHVRGPRRRAAGCWRWACRPAPTASRSSRPGTRSACAARAVTTW